MDAFSGITILSLAFFPKILHQIITLKCAKESTSIIELKSCTG